MGFKLPCRPWRPAPEPTLGFWIGAEILGLPPATMGEAASADCSDMLERLEAREAARLSSTSPSSDSSENPRWCCARGPGSRPVKNEEVRQNKDKGMFHLEWYGEIRCSPSGTGRGRTFGRRDAHPALGKRQLYHWEVKRFVKSNYWEVSALHRAGRGGRG